MLDSYVPDDCCPIADALLKGIAGDRWECPKCGCEWRAFVVRDAIRHWQPVPYVTFG